MVATVYDVAKYIIDKCGPMSAMKLQKLVFYSQAMSLVWDDEELFKNDFEAWAKGPVCRGLYNEHRGLFIIENSNIFKNPTELDFYEYTVGEENLRDYQKETINAIIDAIGGLSPYQLSEMTHNEDPWKEARGDCEDGALCTEIISKEHIAKYYEKYW